MSILKNILGAFVELKDDQSESSKETKQPDVEITAPVNKDYVPETSSSNIAASGRSQSQTLSEYEKHFEELIEEANEKNPTFKGTDFKEFMDSKVDVEAITDEPTKYRTAFNVLKRTGLTKERLVTTAKEYINVIDKDLKAFEGAYNQQYKVDVEQKEQQMQQKAQELQMLTEKIAALNLEMKQMSKEIIKSKDQLTSNKTSFMLAGENKKKEIEVELQKIDQYF